MDKPTFPLAVTIVLVLVMLVTFGLVGGGLYYLSSIASAPPTVAKIDSYDFFFSQGNTYLDQQNYAQAEVYFRKAIEVGPNFPHTYNNLGIVLAETNRFDEAILNYKKAIELSPNYANAYSNLGASYKDTGKYPEALQSLQKAIELYQNESKLDPNTPNAYVNIGEVYRLTGDTENALVNFQKAVSLGSTDPNVLMNIKILEKVVNKK